MDCGWDGQCQHPGDRPWLMVRPWRRLGLGGNFMASHQDSSDVATKLGKPSMTLHFGPKWRSSLVNDCRMLSLKSGCWHTQRLLWIKVAASR